MTKEIQISNIKIGGTNPLVLIAGPCVIEDQKSTIEIAEYLKELSERLGIPFIFKASYDKANRTSIDSFRGPGLKEGLRILTLLKKKLGIPVLTDVHCKVEVDSVSSAVDVVQIPAFLCRQTELLKAVAAKAGCVNIKKGQFLAPWDMKHVINKVESVGNNNILVTERGTSFGYNQLVTDMCSLPILRDFGYPVVFDVTHSLQLPGGLGKASGGMRQFVPYLARAAVACGCDAIFIEVHPEPDKALSDGPNTMALGELETLLEELLKIDRIVRV